MFVQCISLLFFLGSLGNARSVSWRGSSTCSLPYIQHGRVVVRGYRGKMIKFVCDKRYELAGNKYATCTGNNWDVPIPVCIRAGCPLPAIENGIQIPTNNGAYVTHFCLPEYRMIGSPVIYCDGRQWNSTAPICVDSTQQSALSCNFEDPGLCGWTQDEMHDFDWTRLNNKTPSSFLLTGPSFDHTYGSGGSGYYMYIESTSRLRNDTARFMSPVYPKSLSENGCFSFYYHMFGATCGGLRVYQKPDNIALQVLLNLSKSAKEQYILFEQWGNHGDVWMNSVSNLKNLGDNFQIIIEGIRGSSFTSDIAIDDVALLQGDNCTAPTTPSIIYMKDSCAGRCMGSLISSCGCNATCLANNDCCPDFFELCVFMPDSASSDDDFAVSSASNEIPQTQPLVGTSPKTTSTSTSTTASTTTSSTSTTTTTTTTTRRPTTTSRPTTTPRPTTIPKPVTTPKPATTPRPMPTSLPKTTPKLTTIPRPSTNQTTIRITTRRSESTLAIRTTRSKPKQTTRIVAMSSTEKTTTPWKKKYLTTSTTTLSTKRLPTTNKVTTIEMSHGISRTIENHNQYHEMVEKAKKEQAIEVRKLHYEENEKHKSSGWKVVFAVLGTVICLACVSWLMVVSRSARGRLVLARLRGRSSQDPEVRYLSADVDD